MITFMDDIPILAKQENNFKTPKSYEEVILEYQMKISKNKTRFLKYIETNNKRRMKIRVQRISVEVDGSAKWTV